MTLRSTRRRERQTRANALQRTGRKPLGEGSHGSARHPPRGHALGEHGPDYEHHQRIGEVERRCDRIQLVPGSPRGQLDAVEDCVAHATRVKRLGRVLSRKKYR